MKLKELLEQADNAMRARDKLAGVSHLNDEYTCRALADLVPDLTRRLKVAADGIRKFLDDMSSHQCSEGCGICTLRVVLLDIEGSPTK